MANNTSLVFTLLGKDKLSPALDKAGKASGGLGQKLGVFAKRAAIAGAAVGAAFAVEGVRGFLAFDDKMTQSLAIMGKVSGPMRKQMETAARAVGKSTRFGADQAAEAYFFLASAGLDAQASVKALPQVAKFAQAGMFDLARATDLATDAQSALGLASKSPETNLKNLVRVTDVLVKANTLANASVEQFSTALTNKAGAAMRSVGMEIESGVSVLAAFADQGVKAEEAGTQFAIVLRDLQTKALANKEAFQAAGVAVFDADGNFRNMADIVSDLEGHLEGMTAEQRKAALATLGFSDKSMGALITLLGTSDAIRGYEKDLKNAAGTTDQVAKKQLESFRAKLELIKSRVDDVALSVGKVLVNAVFDLAPKIADAATAIGTKLAPALDGVRSAVADAFDDIDLSGVGQSFADAAKGWAGSIIGGVRTGMDSGDWKPLGKSIGTGIAEAINGIGSTIGKLTKALLDVLGKVDWLGIGIGLGKQAPSLVAGIAIGILNVDFFALLKGLAENWQLVLGAVLTAAFLPAKIIGAVSKALAKIPFVGRLLAWGLDAFAKFSKGLVGAVGRFLDDVFIKTLMPGLRSRLVSIGKAFAQLMGELPTRVGIIAINLRQKAVEMMAGLRAAIVGRISSIVVGIKDLIAKMLAPFARAATWLVNRGREFVSGLKNGVVNAARGIGSWVFQRVIQPLTSRFLSAGTWLVNRGRDVVSGLKSGIFNAARGIGSWVSQRVIQPVTSRFSKASSWLVNSGRNILSGLKSGIVRSMRGIASWVKSRVVDPIVKAVKRFFGIRSPSTVFAGIGANLVGGLLKGLGSNMGGAIARKVFGDMPNALGAIVSKGLISVKNLPGKAMKALSGLGGKFADLFGGLGGAGRAPGNVSGNAAVVQTAAAQRGWGTGAQWNALHKLIMGESGFRNTAQNPDSSAYGMFQFLDSTWAGVGGHKTSDPWLQSTYGLRYISQVYGNPLNAYSQWLSRSPHWYEKGSFSVPQTGPAVVHRGEMILPEHFASAVRSSLAGGGDDRLEQLLVRIAEAAEAAAQRGDSQVVLDTGVLVGEVTRSQRADSRGQRVAAGTAGWH